MNSATQDLPWSTRTSRSSPPNAVKAVGQGVIVYSAPDKRRAERECDFLSRPVEASDDPLWTDGESPVYYRVERRTPAWCVLRYPRSVGPVDVG